MSKYDKAGLAMIPSGYKASKVYSLIPNSSDGDFDFSRASTATRVNKDGLIETVASGVPRLDYPLIDGVVQESPALLLEPSRTNNQVYSEEFDNALWGKVNVTISSNDTISPDGSQNADKISETSDTGLHVVADGQSFVSGTSYVFSCFAKKGTSKDFRVAAGNPGTIPISSIFDLEDGTVTSSSGSSTSTIEYFGNGWYRCSVVATASSTATTNLNLGLANGTTTNYAGNTSNNLYIWGAMVEQGSYATSYIPTSGSTVTRTAETCNGAGTSAEFNDSEGVLFAETANIDKNETANSVTFSISDGTLSNAVTLYYFTTGGVYYDIFNSSGTRFGNIAMTKEQQATSNKIALKYKSTDISLWVNGFELDTNSGTLTLSGLNEAAFDYGSGALPFYGKTKQLITFKEALTDAELEDLTSWDSFSEMAIAQEYKTY